MAWKVSEIGLGSTLLGVLVASALYALHRPLPPDFPDYAGVTVAEFLLRLFFFYPFRALGRVDKHWQLTWARAWLEYSSRLLGPQTLDDPDLNITDITLDGVPVRLYVPWHPRGSGAIMYFHGGAFVLFDVAAYDSLTRELARASGLVVVSVDYRRGPEAPYPAAVEDSERATRHFLRTAANYGVDHNKVALMGDSAGGNLVAVLARRLRDKPEAANIAFQVLVYPLLQFVDLQSPSYQHHHAFMAGTSFLDPESLVEWILLYLGAEPEASAVATILANNHTTALDRELLSHLLLPEASRNHSAYRPPDLSSSAGLGLPFTDPDFCPLCEVDLGGLPPALVLTAEYDILRDDGCWYEARLAAAGVPVTRIHYPTFHGFLNLHPVTELGKDTLQILAATTRTTLENDGKQKPPPLNQEDHSEYRECIGG